MDPPVTQKRSSAIPVPRSSKLPLPGKPLPDALPHTAIRPLSSLGHNGFVGSNGARIQPPLARARGSVSSVRDRPNSRPIPGAPSAPRRTPATRQPLANGRNDHPTPAKEEVNGPVNAQSIEDATTFKRPQPFAREASEQENIPHTDGSSEGSELGGSTVPSTASISPIKMPKKSRPSLSDRTIESLSQIPTSPMTDRRRSSFFAPQSPMTPQRPPSALGGSTTMPKLSYGSMRGTPHARPASPAKRPTSSHTPKPPQRRSVSAAVPQGANPSTTPKPAPIRTQSPSKMPQPGSAVLPERPKQQRPQSAVLTRPVSRTAAAGQQEATRMRPPSPMKRPIQSKPAPKTKVTGKEPKSPSTNGPTSASSVLRQQIAQARAAARNAQTKQHTLGASPKMPGGEFDAVEDPFNLRPKDGKDDLRKRIDSARRDGRLNIAAMGFNKLPVEVLQMYDPEAMEASTVTWSETVDLVRLNAADNDLAELEDEAFPDTSPDSLAASEDGRGNQFGGLDALDLHGNQLSHLPIGLRQLTRLTSLNLSRNKLDEWAFDIITQIPTLCDLNLANNNISQNLPESISRLSLLETVDLSWNRLVTLPTTLRDLGRLRSLNVSSNRLTAIPFDQLAVLPRLTDLTASSNALTGALFPSSVTTMQNLRTLDVSGNALASFTFSRTLNLPSLLRLDVSRNRLGMFPAINEWTCLTTLLADENALSEFPRGMVGLTTKLRTVSLERNSLREIDEGIADMEGLEVLGLAGNPLRDRKLLTSGAVEIKLEMQRRQQLANGVSGGAA